MTKNIATISKFLLIFVLIGGWIFSGWPRLWQNPPFPPRIQEARADTTGNLVPINNGGAQSTGWLNKAGTQCAVDGTNCYDEVNDTPGSHDSNASYIQKGTQDTIDSTYDLDISSIPNNSTITAVNITIVCYGSGATSKVQTVRRIDGTLTASGSDYICPKNSWGSSAQNHTGLNIIKTGSTDFEIGVRGTQNRAALVTSIYADITYSLPITITLTVDSPTKSLGNITPGTPVTATTIATVTTNNSTGYSLKISDSVAGSDSALLHTDTTTRIADYAAPISAPTTWTGTGLGICVYIATNKNTSQWGTGITETDSNNKYAGIPQTTTEIHNVGSAVTNDNTYIGYKLNVPTSQKIGAYSGVVTHTAVVN